jgi:hypothetical protein
MLCWKSRECETSVISRTKVVSQYGTIGKKWQNCSCKRSLTDVVCVFFVGFFFFSFTLFPFTKNPQVERREGKGYLSGIFIRVLSFIKERSICEGKFI